MQKYTFSGRPPIFQKGEKGFFKLFIENICIFELDRMRLGNAKS